LLPQVRRGIRRSRRLGRDRQALASAEEEGEAVTPYNIHRALLGREDDMARRRLQERGDMRNVGGWWKLRWRTDTLDPETRKVKRVWSETVTLGPAKGNGAELPAMTEKQARRKAWDEYLSKLDSTVLQPRSAVTLAEFIERKYRPEHLMMLERNTRTVYQSILGGHILPMLGKMRLCDIRRDDVQTCIMAILEDGKGRTAELARAIISSIFRLAEDAEWVTGNPARRVRMPKRYPHQRRALTRAQAAQLYAAMDPRYAALVRFLVLTGMRPGEAAGLKWRHVHGMSIDVRETFTNGHWKAAPKNRRGERTIAITIETRALLDALANDGELVFPNTQGQPLDLGNIGTRYLKPAGKAAGVPWVNWYTLRHTAITWADGVLSSAEKGTQYGHTAKMSEHYTHPERDEIRGKLERVN